MAFGRPAPIDYGAVSYIVEKEGANYYATSETRGLPSYKGTNIKTVVQNAIDALPGANIRAGTIYWKRAEYLFPAGNGLLLGKSTLLVFEPGVRILLQGNLTAIGGSYTHPAMFTIDDAKKDYETMGGIKGEGGGAYIRMSSTDVGGVLYNGDVVYSPYFSNEAMLCQQVIENLYLQNIKQGYSALDLAGVFRAKIKRMKIRTYGDGITIREGPTVGPAVHWGNQYIEDIMIGFATTNTIGLNIIGGATHRACNLMECHRLQIGGAGTAQAGQIGVKILRDGWISFYDLNLEGAMIGVQMDDSHWISFVKVLGTVTTAGAKGFELVGSTYGINARDLYLDYPADVWDDQNASAQTYERRNIINNMRIEGGTIDYGRNTVVNPSKMTIVFFMPTQTAADGIWTNQPAAKTELFGNADRRIKVDLRHFHSARLITNVEAAGVAGSFLAVEYSTNEVAWAGLMTGTLNPRTAIDAVGTIAYDWDGANYALAAGAKSGGDVFLRVVGDDGNGVVDPEFGLIALQLR